jgi:uncharacterized protein
MVFGDARSGKLADNIVGFGRALRRAGVKVDSQRIALAKEAALAVGVNEKEDLSAAFEAVMVSREQDRLVFRELFDVYFQDPKVGPVSAKFTGKITLCDIQSPASYKLSFDGQGGPAGFGKGSAAVTLIPNNDANADGCALSYSVNATVGGKVAQLGQRLIDGAAKSMAEDFFKRFDLEMQRQHPEGYAAKVVTGDAPAEPMASVQTRAVPIWFWIGGAVVATALVAWLIR